MSYEFNILVNGNRCKQYNHNGKIFIEAKQGSEYSLEVKNNSWQRIMAICSVDGLDILNGEPAAEDGPGYIINGYNANKFEGFRISSDKVAKFVFDYKKSSYAASKEDGSEKNVGVIAVRIFEEKVKPAPQVIHHYHNDYYWNNPPIWNTPINPWPTIWCGGTTCGIASANLLANCENNNTISNDKTNITYNCSNAPGACFSDNSGQTMNCSQQENRKGFDMGTSWGKAKESKVIEVEFERGILAFSTNIYYASRQSLLEMGIPIGNEKQVSFPEPFVNSKYSKPPKNWRE